MKKYLAHVLLIPLVIMALVPPWVMRLTCDVNSFVWILAAFTSGFLTFLFLNFKVNAFFKLFLVWSYFSCFISRAPYVSFTMFWTLILCAYYYLGCTKIENFEPVKKAIQAIFFFITLLIILQCLSLDTLLNFNATRPSIMGTIGNRMMLASYVCVLAPFLIHRPLNWVAIGLIAFISGSSGMMLSVFCGLAFLLFRKYKKFRTKIVLLAIFLPLAFICKTEDFEVFSRAGRGPVWVKTVELIKERPQGYGIATYKILFPILCGEEIKNEQPGAEWKRAHNDWLQIPFEVGIPGALLLLGALGAIVRKVRDPVKGAGLIIVGMNMMVAFPMRMVQSVLILLMFLAYVEHDKVLKYSDLRATIQNR